ITISCLVMMVLSCSTPVLRRSTPTVPPEAVLTEARTAELPTEAPLVKPPTEEPTPATGIPLEASQVYQGNFAKYSQAEVSLPAEFLGGYSLPVNLDGVESPEPISLTEGQKQALSANGFVVAAPVYPTDELFT